MHGYNYSYHRIFLHDNLPRTEGALFHFCARQQNFGSLDPSWCYRYIRFTIHQLQLLHELLNPPPWFIIQGGKYHGNTLTNGIMASLKQWPLNLLDVRLRGWCSMRGSSWEVEGTVKKCSLVTIFWLMPVLNSLTCSMYNEGICRSTSVPGAS